MFDIDTWREILQSMNKNRVRSILSGFTVAFAIMLFTVLIGIANGLENTFKEAFVDDADNAIFVYSGRTTKAHKGLQAGRQIQFKNEDYEYVKEEYSDKIEYSSARIFKNVNASFRGEKNSYTLMAVHPDHQYLEKTEIKEGRYFNQKDINEKAKVVVIGRLVEEDLFLKTVAVGKYINLSGIQYKIVGVFTDDGGDNEERKIYMPFTAAQLIYGNNDYIDQMALSYNRELSVDQAIDFGIELEKKLKNRFLIAPNDQRAVRINNMAQNSQGVKQFTTVLSLIIFVIGLGTLIAGIVGISNIMIFIVKERTKEIGIRKALGAKPSSIVSIILIESVVITAIAGYLGLLLGVGLLRWIGPGLEDYFIKDPGVSIGLVFSATVVLILSGALAGYLPAKKASRIKPIVALRDD